MAYPVFEYFISGNKEPINQESRFWALPLKGEGEKPVSYKNIQDNTKNKACSIGVYLTAARQFIEKNNFKVLENISKELISQEIEKICLSLEKHGAFYHPIKVTLFYNGLKPIFLVLNGAVSKQGLKIIKDEYNMLGYFDQTYEKSYLPKVFGMNFIEVEKQRIAFFLGQWFEGYHEFHVSKTDQGFITAVWEDDGSVSFVSDKHALKIYKQIARILTYYYNIETFEQIFPWHHAAGDFIIKPIKDDFLIKLITVRGFSSMLEFDSREKPDLNMVLTGLLQFFLNLSLQIRLDRVDGINEPILISRKIIPEFIQGFFQGLDDKTFFVENKNLKHEFIGFAGQFSQEQLLEIFLSLIGSYGQNSSEIPIILNDLKNHCETVYNHLKNMAI